MEVIKAGEVNGVLQVRLSTQSDVDLRENIYRKIKETDWILLEFYQEGQTLEDIFRKLTKEN
jgi:ABC-2 type transport system ATP-binding protein